MVRRQCAILRGERRALLVRQLLGVEADPEAMMGGGLEQPLDLLRGEGDGVAKGIDAGRDPLFGRGGNELIDDLADIMGAAVGLIRRDGVEREQGRDDAHGFGFAKLVGNLQEPKFTLGVETVARFHFDSRATSAHQSVQAAARLFEQLFVRCRGGALDR